MDFNKIFIKNASPTKIGGQAVLEGIMMRGAKDTAVVIRRANGELHIKKDPLPEPRKVAKWPIVRGVYAFVDSLLLGTKTLMYSAEVLEQDVPEEERESDKFGMWLEKKFGRKGSMDFLMYTSVIFALVFTVGIFIIAPTAVVNVFKHFTENEIILNLIEGVFRILIFVGYIALISLMKDIRTTFQYHGAEHKMIHCYENGLELTAENARPFPTLHPRCGTSFLMFVMILSLLIFSFLGWPNLALRIGSRLLFIPIIAGLSYELLKWAGKSDSWVVKILSYPGIALQQLTTREPDDKQLELAAVALRTVMTDDEQTA